MVALDFQKNKGNKLLFFINNKQVFGIQFTTIINEIGTIHLNSGLGSEAGMNCSCPASFKTANKAEGWLTDATINRFPDTTEDMHSFIRQAWFTTLILLKSSCCLRICCLQIYVTMQKVKCSRLEPGPGFQIFILESATCLI